MPASENYVLGNVGFNQRGIKTTAARKCRHMEITFLETLVLISPKMPTYRNNVLETLVLISPKMPTYRNNVLETLVLISPKIPTYRNNVLETLDFKILLKQHRTVHFSESCGVFYVGFCIIKNRKAPRIFCRVLRTKSARALRWD